MSLPDDKHKTRLKNSYAEWLKHRTILEAYRVKAGDRRTTPPPAYDVGKLFPQLATRTRTTICLHPRYGDEPPADASKMGGTFFWPEDEPWPICRHHGIPFVTVLQLRASDFPEMPFPPEAELVQVLWCPREHEDIPECRDKPSLMSWADPRFFWRKPKQMARASAVNPDPQEAYYEYVPFPCRLLPERVIEFPSIHDLTEDVVQDIYRWEDQHLGPDGMHTCEYESDLSVSTGTKVGAYIRWIQFPWNPICECGKAMEHLLTIATVEWNGIIDQRWTPVEEQQHILASFPHRWDDWDEKSKAIHGTVWNPTGLSLGDAGDMKLFVCRHCGKWPIVPHIECS